MISLVGGPSLDPVSGTGDRHRRGPGGPSRPTRSGRVTPPAGRRHRPEVSGLLDPTLAQMVSTLLHTARGAVPAGHPAPGVALERWAQELAATSFDDEAMPRAFYVDLGRTLAEADDRLAPAALAALALVLRHRDAAPLRRARADWLAAGPADPDADLGIGREVPVRAVTIGHPDEDEASVVIGFAAAGGAHSIGVLVDDAHDGLGRDLFVGPAVDAIEADAAADPELVVAEIPLAEAASRMAAALAVADAEAWDDPEDLATRPLVDRRLELVPRS